MYIEKDVAASIDNRVIIQQFQNIKTSSIWAFFFFFGDANAQYMGNWIGDQ